ncbi:hypothetical protein MVEN_01430200 [Mycena venus]|uniref:DUF6532 domain-containing protein n=1 Tax=Mycena venus TaxID=2733690 RepID=A0A8H6XXQ6_9AGAR|nr:hypothetical protein MVEN_01430200 [Mycena venus]
MPASGSSFAAPSFQTSCPWGCNTPKPLTTLSRRCTMTQRRPHKPTLSLVTLAIAITALRASIMEYSSGHFLAEEFSRKVYKAHFDAELNTLREWHKFTSNPTLIPGGGPVRMAPPTFLTRTLQENMYAEARYNVLKDVVAPVPSAEVMDQSDFALNQ